MTSKLKVCVIFGLVLAFALLSFFPSVQADSFYEVSGPTADSYANSLGNLVYPYKAQKLDHSYSWMYDGSWIRNENFTSTDVAEYWAPYENRTTFPANDDTILDVKFYCVYFCVDLITFKMTFQTQNESGSWSDFGPAKYFTVGPYANHYWREASYDITWYQSWTPSLLVNSTSAVNLTVTNGGGSVILIDYFGLQYTWNETYETEHNWYNFPKISLNLGAIFGILGFIGMIGALPIGVWYYRRTEGNRIQTAVYIFLGFILCYVLFLVGSNS